MRKRTFESHRGIHHRHAKLTEDNVREIRRRAAQGETRQSIATHFGITHSAVTKVVNRYTWAHVKSNP